MYQRSKVLIFATLFFMISTVSAASPSIEERKEAMLSHIRSISDAAGYVGYYDAIVLTQEMLKRNGKKIKNDTTDYTVSDNDFLLMAKQRDGHLKELKENLESVKDNVNCAAAYLELMQSSRGSNFLRAVVQSLMVVKSSPAEERDWTMAYDVFRKNMNRKLFEKVQDNCVKLN